MKFPSLVVAPLCILLFAAFTSELRGDDAPPTWLRGSGQDLEFLIHGEVVDADGQPTKDVALTFTMNADCTAPAIKPQLDGHKFSAWIPAGVPSYYSLGITATTPHNNQSAAKFLANYELRQSAIDGLQLTLKKPVKKKRVRVTSNGQPVANATVKVELGVLQSSQAQTDAEGVAQFHLLDEQEISDVFAWTDDRRVGGYTLSRGPSRDPNAEEFPVELSDCRDLRIRFIDENEAPVPGVPFTMQIATPPPHYNYIGTNDEFHLTSDASGEAVLHWLPDWERHHAYPEVHTNAWFIDGEPPQITGDTYIVRLNKSRPRKMIEGRVTSTVTSPAGFQVELSSFQGERENYSDSRRAFTDADGRFSIDVLPEIKYCGWVLDSRWVAKTIDLIPYSPGLDQTKSPEFVVTAGEPVEITATTGKSKKPYRNLQLYFRREHDFQWQENGETRNGSSGPQWWAKTNERGRATTITAPGELNVSVYSPQWRTEQSIDVKPNEPARVTLHREVDEKRALTGRVTSADTLPVPLESVTVQIASIDGANQDEQDVLCDANGTFRFETLGTQLAVYAATSDNAAAGSAAITDLDQPIEVQLHPTLTLRGQLFSDGGQPRPHHRLIVHPRIESGEQNVNASFRRFFEPRRYELLTDDEGKFSIANVPCQTPLNIFADSIESNSDTAFLDEILLEPGESRDLTLKFTSSHNLESEQPLAERFASSLRDCQLGGYRPLLILAAASPSGPVAEFVHDSFRNDDKNPAVYDYMQIMAVAELEKLTEADAAFLKDHGFDFPDADRITAILLDTEGKPLATLPLDPRDAYAAATAADFLREHAPPRADAEQKWTNAFAEAKRTNRRVWVRVSQRYCGPCFRLARWLDDQHELLAKDYVLLKVDDAHDIHGPKFAKRLTRGNRHGVPFHAIFDANELLLIDSAGPLGNIGFPASPEGQRHLEKMLTTTRQELTDADINELLDSLDN
jgi:hypothetical protein